MPVAPLIPAIRSSLKYKSRIYIIWGHSTPDKHLTWLTPGRYFYCISVAPEFPETLGTWIARISLAKIRRDSSLNSVIYYVRGEFIRRLSTPIAVSNYAGCLTFEIVNIPLEIHVADVFFNWNFNCDLLYLFIIFITLLTLNTNRKYHRS